MYGPQALGFWSQLQKADGGSQHQLLEIGQHYCVVKSFIDYDKTAHPIGEAWQFLGSSFLPYDDGLSLFVSLDGESEWHIRMQWRSEEQGGILDSFNEYVHIK